MIKKDIYRISICWALTKGDTTLKLSNKARIEVSSKPDNIIYWSNQHNAFISRGDAISINATLFENDEIKKQYVFQKTNKYTEDKFYEFVNKKDDNNTNPFFKEVVSSYTFTDKSISKETQKAIKNVSRVLKHN